MNNLRQDFIFALRQLRKSPVFTAVAVLSLALGIGANTAIFSLLDQVLLRMLPVKQPEQLVQLAMKGFHYGSNWGMNAMSYPMYHDLSEHNEVFSGMFCRFGYPFSLSFRGRTERAAGELVTGTYFPVLGVGAAVGRTFTPDDDRIPNGHPLAVLSYNYWASRFSKDRSVVGKSLTINGHDYTVIGVAQAGFDGVEIGRTTDVFVPLMMKAQVTPGWDDMKNRRQRWVNAFGRLKPGVTRQRAQASLAPYFHSMLEMEVKEAAFRNAANDVRQRFLKNVLEVQPGAQGRSYIRRQLTAPLWVLMALTGGVLLIACANVASLLIARATARQKEMAIRLALGAARARLIQQLLVESLTLSFAGGLLGLGLAIWTVRLLMAFLPPDTATLNISKTPDPRILLFTMVVSLLTGVIFGLLPALRSTKPDVAPVLKDQAGGVVGAGAAQVRFRKGLVAAQVTLSLLLLIGAGLFIRSLRNLQDLGPGFPVERLIGLNINPTLNGYADARTKVFYKQLQESLASAPGVQSAALAGVRILEDNEWDSWMTIEGYTAKGNEVPSAYMNSISPRYFETLGFPLVAGRDFNDKDTQEIKHNEDKEDGYVPRVAIVNEKFAKKYFHGRSALGRHVGFGIDPNTRIDMEIVGVVKDIKYTNLRDEIPTQMFLPYMAQRRVGGMTAYVRTSLDPNQAFNSIRERVRQLDPNLPIYGMRTTEEQITNSLLVERLIASLSTVFGCLATLLAAIGLYGVMAYTVTRRTREIGIRVALGAFGGDVIWMVMREVIVLVVIGVTAGLIAAMVLTRFVQSQLFGLTANDPLTLAAATLGLGAVACLAGYIPALRASRVDAMRALRWE